VLLSVIAVHAPHPDHWPAGSLHASSGTDGPLPGHPRETPDARSLPALCPHTARTRPTRSFPTDTTAAHSQHGPRTGCCQSPSPADRPCPADGGHFSPACGPPRPAPGGRRGCRPARSGWVMIDAGSAQRRPAATGVAHRSRRVLPKTRLRAEIHSSSSTSSWDGAVTGSSSRPGWSKGRVGRSRPALPATLVQEMSVRGWCRAR